MKQTPIEIANASTPPSEEIRSALELVPASGGFRRAERHAKFLRFVCETTLNGEGNKLNEYLIAHDVFGRGDDYAPSEDSIVRRQAHSLRQKLQEYYSGEGADAAIRIELPIGRYIPHFVRSVEVPEVREAPEPVAPAAAPGSRKVGGAVAFTGWKDQKRLCAGVNRSRAVSAAKSPTIVNMAPNNTIRLIGFSLLPLLHGR